MQFSLPSKGRVIALSQSVASAAAGAVFYATMFGVVKDGDAATATHAIAQIGDGFREIVAGVSALVPICIGMIAAVKASPLVEMVTGAFAMLHGKADPAGLSVEDQKTVMEATAKLPKVTKVGTNDANVAATTSAAIVLDKGAA